MQLPQEGPPIGMITVSLPDMGKWVACLDRSQSKQQLWMWLPLGCGCELGWNQSGDCADLCIFALWKLPVMCCSLWCEVHSRQELETCARRDVLGRSHLMLRLLKHRMRLSPV